MPAPDITITRRVRFSAARVVTSRTLDEAGNERLFGLGVRLHGHDFVLDVTLRGPLPAETGMVMDLKALSRLIKSEVVGRLDHTRLDRAEMLAGRPATTENLAGAIWRRLEAVLPPETLTEVSLADGGKTVRYRGE